MGLLNEILNSFAANMEKQTRKNLSEQARSYSGSDEDKETYNRAQEMYEKSTQFSSTLGRNVNGRDSYADSMHSRATENVTSSSRPKNRF